MSKFKIVVMFSDFVSIDYLISAERERRGESGRITHTRHRKLTKRTNDEDFEQKITSANYYINTIAYELARTIKLRVKVGIIDLFLNRYVHFLLLLLGSLCFMMMSE